MCYYNNINNKFCVAGQTNNNWYIKHSIWVFLILTLYLFLNTLKSVSDMIEVDQGQVGCLLNIITCMCYEPSCLNMITNC